LNKNLQKTTNYIQFGFNWLQQFQSDILPGIYFPIFSFFQNTYSKILKPTEANSGNPDKLGNQNNEYP